ncbi:TPA: hypothetical protein G8O00_000917 [Salmonella enterica]|uniref:Uncharacterized protein n=1 Tax=Salmonella enterica TaxID=28901 RepID=A0A747SP45_SALER|nr:hypothetical protein [Salmonella enterica]HAF4697561.1 hypothetical protein [Salmonella enterica]
MSRMYDNKYRDCGTGGASADKPQLVTKIILWEGDVVSKKSQMTSGGITAPGNATDLARISRHVNLHSPLLSVLVPLFPQPSGAGLHYQRGHNPVRSGDKGTK